MPDELPVFPIADAGHVDVLDCIDMDAVWREQTHVWSVSDPDAEGTTHLTSPSRAVPPHALADASVPILALRDALRSEGYLTVQHRIVHQPGEAPLVDVRRQLAARSYFEAVLFSKDVFAKGNESFPSDKSAAFYKLLVKSHGPIDARTIAAVCAECLDELEGNVRPAPTDCTEPLCCCVASGATCSTVDGDEGGLLIAQPAAPVEPGPAAGADAIVPTADEEKIDGGQDNVDFPCTLCGQTLRRESHGSRLDFVFRFDCKTHAKCRKYRSYKVGLQQFGHFACLYWQQHSTSAGTLARQMPVLGCCVSRRNKRIFQWSSDKAMSSCGCATES